MRAAPTFPILAAALLGATAALPATAMVQCGTASWYDEGAGQQSADGGVVDPAALAAAHPSLPIRDKSARRELEERARDNSCDQ